jgi:hypothetical protein
MLLGAMGVKAARKYVDDIDPRSQLNDLRRRWFEAFVPLKKQNSYVVSAFLNPNYSSTCI